MKRKSAIRKYSKMMEVGSETENSLQVAGRNVCPVLQEESGECGISLSPGGNRV